MRYGTRFYNNRYPGGAGVALFGEKAIALIGSGSEAR
jgi:hypothetical protein